MIVMMMIYYPECRVGVWYGLPSRSRYERSAMPAESQAAFVLFYTVPFRWKQSQKHTRLFERIGSQM